MQKLLITGITGSFGRAFLKHVESNTTWDIVGIARNESKLEELAAAGTRARLLPRDITDPYLDIDCDAIVHAAALKRVDSSYENPEEYARINIGGTVNIARLAKSKQARLLFISSDKACQAHNIYGATKRVGEGIVIAAGGSAVRGGNVWMSSGSVSQKFAAAVLGGYSAVLYDAEATRFNAGMPFWVNFVLTCLLQMNGGEIWAPKLRAYQMGDLADAFRSVHGLQIMHGNRQQGDKRAEYLVSPIEARWTKDIGTAYIQGGDWVGTAAPAEGVSSKTARRMSILDLQELVRQL